MTQQKSEHAAKIDIVERMASVQLDEKSRETIRGLSSIVERELQSRIDTFCDQLRPTPEALGRSDEPSQNIGLVIGSIDELAVQTNLLALNASLMALSVGVESTRPGDAGRDFDGVVSEVRALAECSAEAAKEITNLINSAASEATTGVELAVATGKVLERIAAQVGATDRLVSVIAAGAAKRSSALQAERLANSVGQFQVSGRGVDSEAPAVPNQRPRARARPVLKVVS